MQNTTVVQVVPKPKPVEPQGNEAEGQQNNGFHLTVKVKGGNGYAGKGWVNPSKFGGKYVSVYLTQDVKAGSTLYLTPKKECPEVLG